MGFRVVGLNRTFYSVNVSETDLSRFKLSEREWITNKAAIRQADMVLLPWHQIENEDQPIFPQGTADLFRFLQSLDLGKVELSSTPEQFREIAMHGKAWRLPTILLTQVALPVFVGVASNALSDMLPGIKSDDTIHFEMVVERPHAPCISIKYEGPAERFGETLLKESARCFEKEEEK